MYSKYERRTDTRTYEDRRKLYEGVSTTFYNWFTLSPIDLIKKAIEIFIYQNFILLNILKGMNNVMQNVKGLAQVTHNNEFQ